MKKIFMAACMMLFSTAMFAEQGDLYVGGNLNYGMHSDYKNLGIGVKGQFEFVDHFRGEASYNYFFEKDYCKMWDVNANVHYLFNINDQFTVYPLAGLTALGAKVDVPATIAGIPVGEVSDSDTKVGFNIGGGVDYFLTEKVKLNAELKYQIVKDLDRPVLSVGIAFAL